MTDDTDSKHGILLGCAKIFAGLLFIGLLLLIDARENAVQHQQQPAATAERILGLADRLSNVDLRLDDSSSPLTYPRLSALLQEKAQPLFGGRDLDQVSFSGGMVKADLVDYNDLWTITIHAPCKGSIYGIHIGDSCRVARQIAHAHQWAGDYASHGTPSFTFGSPISPGGPARWTVRWSEDDHHITEVSMHDNRILVPK